MKILTLANIAAAVLLAHDSYLMPAKFTAMPGKSLMVSLHNGDSFPNSEFATDPGRIVTIRLSDGTPVNDLQIVGRATHGFAQMRQAGSLYAVAETAPKQIEMAPAKFEAYLREEGLTHILRSRTTAGPARELYRKYAKAYIVSGTPDRAFSTPVGLEIEIVPEADPASLRPGAKLPVRVLFRGKGLAGVQLEKASQNARSVVGRTDAEGRIEIPIERDGKWRLHAVHMERARDLSQAEWESYWASLTFEVK